MLVVHILKDFQKSYTSKCTISITKQSNVKKTIKVIEKIIISFLKK